MVVDLRVRGALTTTKRRWSADDLGALIDQLDRSFGSLGIGAEHRVAIACADTGICVAAFLACRSAGAVPIPLSARELGPRAVGLADMVADCEPRAAIVDARHARGLADSLQRAGTDLIQVDQDGRVELTARPAAGLSRTAHPPGTGLLCYTSGTEKQAKGVLLASSAVNHVLHQNQQLNGWSSDDRVLIAVPATHMYGLIQTTAAVVGGAEVFISPDFGWLGQVFDQLRNRITAASLVPSQLGILIRQPEFRSITDLRRVWLAAAPINRRDVETALELQPQLRLSSSYGLTEAFRCTVLSPDDIPARLPSIGRPQPGVDIELRAVDGSALPAGEERGIAWVRGPSVMTGYWKRPDATAEALRDGWFCTNDIIRRSADGYFAIEGRRKEVLCCGGEKLSPELLEDLIAAGCPVDDVAVLGIQDGSDFDQVVTAVVHADGVPLTLEAVRSACASFVQRPFLPTRMFRLPKLPRNAAGKLDRTTLRQLLAQQDSGG